MTTLVADLDDLHLQHDIEHAVGCVEWKPRVNLLGMVSGFTDHMGLTVGRLTKFQPEGYGYHERLRNHLMVPILEEKDKSLLCWNTIEALPPLDSLLWFRNVQSEQFLTSDYTEGYIYDVTSSWLPFPMPKPSDEFRMLELFSGSFGGWKFAARHVQDASDLSFQTVSVDHDHKVASNFAITHCTNLLRTTKFLPVDLFCRSHEDWTICADVLDKDLLKAICMWSPHFASVSAPCPPWSRSGRGGGLNRPEGMLLLRVLMMLRWVQVTFVLLEQVATVTSHEHFEIIQHVLHWVGFRLAWYRTADMQDLCRAARPRWLALLVRIHADIPAVPPQIWKRIDRNLLPNPKIDLPPAHLDAMKIHPEEMTFATDPQYMKYKGRAWAMDMKDINVLGLRTYNGGTTPCFLARYGTQYLLDPNMLQEQGFHGHYVGDTRFPESCRLWHPSEIAVMHGIAKPTFLPSDPFLAWFGLGNMITVQHAMLPLIHMLNRCREQPFDLQEMLDSFRADQYLPSQVQLKDVAGGYLVCPKDMLFTTCFIDAIDALVHYESGMDGTFWSPKYGVLPLDQATRPMEFPKSSQLSSPEIEDDEHDSDQAPTFLAAIHWTDHTEKFWFSGNIPGEQIQGIWNYQFHADFHDVTEAIVLDLHPRPLDFRPVTPHDACIVALLDSELTLMHCTPDAILSQKHLQAMGHVLYDQFGIITSHQKPKPWTLVLLKPLSHPTIPFDLVHLMSAFTTLTIRWTLDFATNIFHCHTEGPETQQTIWGTFWNSILTDQLCQILGRRAVWNVEDHSAQFQPLCQGVCPVLHFRCALAVMSARLVLDHLAKQTLSDEPVTEVQLVLDGRPLWQGQLPVGMSLSVIFKALQITVGVTTDHVSVRLIHKGKQRMPEAILQEFVTAEPIRFHIGHMLTGGGSKDQLKQMHQSALAATLLEHGFALAWVTPTVDAIVRSTGLQKLNTITALPMGHGKLAAIKKLCADQSIDIPTPVKPQSQKSFSGAPWNKKPKVDKLDPSEFTLAPNYFFNEDDTVAAQISQIRPQATGLCLLTSAQATPWLREGTPISSDELGILVLGVPPPTKLPIKDLTFPCLNGDGASVLLHGHLVQLGGKAVKVKPPSQATVAAAANQLMSVTLYKSDWPTEQWQDAIYATSSFIRKVLRPEGLDTAISALWGRSLRDGRAPASPQQATSLQMHCTVEQNKIQDLLKISGFNKLFMVPKQTDGTLHPEFRLIWIGKDLTKAIAMSAQVSTCMGLVKGRGDALGLRFAKSAFDAAWKTFYPGQDPPESTAEDSTYRIQGLPFGCSHQMLVDWGKTLGWPCKPYKAIGPQTWLVKAITGPKADEILMFNTSPVLVTKLEVRQNANPKQVMLGPRSSKSSPSAGVDPWLQAGQDPWASYPKQSAPVAAEPARQVAGPVEARFQAQAQEITQLRDDLTKLSKTQEQHASEVAKQFQAAEERDRQTAQNVQTSLTKMQQSWDKSLHTAMTHHTKAMDTQFQELKALFMQSKRKTREDGDDSMDGS